jgi:predicted RNA-binding protein Jag
MNTPIYVLRGNSPPQIRQLLTSLYPVEYSEQDISFKSALDEAKEAVEAIKEDRQESIELSPQSAYIRRLQHLVAERSGLFSQSTGKDPNRRVRIYKT